MERMKVSLPDYLDELCEEFENEDEESKQNNKHNKISLLIEDVGWGWCSKGHEVFLERGMSWKKNKCKGCKTNKTPKVYKCFSCSDYDQIYNKKKYDKSGKKYLWCHDCVKHTNPIDINKRIKLNENIKKRIINTRQIHGKLNIDIITGLKRKQSLNYLLNEISISQNKRKFALYMFNIDTFSSINEKRGYYKGDKILQSIGEILTDFDEKREGNWLEESVSIMRTWCFRVNGDTFGIVTQCRGQIYEQESFYCVLNNEIKKLNICISVGICCIGLQNTNEYMQTGIYNAKSECDSYFIHPIQSSNIKKAADWILFANKALNVAKNNGKDCYRIYDDSQIAVVDRFNDY